LTAALPLILRKLEKHHSISDDRLLV